MPHLPNLNKDSPQDRVIQLIGELAKAEVALNQSLRIVEKMEQQRNKYERALWEVTTMTDNTGGEIALYVHSILK